MFNNFSIRASLFCLLFLVTVICVLAAPGDLDPLFGNGGKVTTNFGGSENCNAVALQSDGKIITAGGVIISGPGANPNFALARYNADGTLDTSFDGDGKVTTDFLGFYDVALSIAIQPDGKIVVAGSAGNSLPGQVGGGSIFALARYNSDGSLDTTFDGDGKVTTSFVNGQERALDLALQPDGKIIAVGDAFGPNGGGGVALARYNSNGSLDTSFDTDGKIIGSYGNAQAVALQSDGKIVIGGYAQGMGEIDVDYDFMVARLNSNGQLDTTFGTNGVSLTDMSGGVDDRARDIALQADGKIVAVGYAVFRTGDFAMIRLNTNGTLDNGFGNGGKVIAEFGSLASEATSVEIQTDGKIVTVGSVSPNGFFGFDFGLTRHTTNGSIDTTFGNGGKVITDFNNGNDIGFGVELQPDGKIIIAGSTFFNSTSDFALARYLTTASRSTLFDFDGDGKADVSVYRPTNGAWYLLNSTSGFTATQFGVSTDKIVPADYDGDGRGDVAVYRDGTWYLQRSTAGFLGISFGAPTDIPMPADFDGDGKSETAVFRPSGGGWYIYNLATNQSTAVQFGQMGDIPVAADYDGDGKADIAVFRSGTWYLLRSRDGFTGVDFGQAGDKPVPADYDGDGRADVAVFRPSNGVWYLQRSQLGFTGIAFGLGSDLPVPADYDGDGRADVAVFRNETWYIQRSQSGFTGVAFGTNADKPVPNAFVP